MTAAGVESPVRPTPASRGEQLAFTDLDALAEPFALLPHRLASKVAVQLDGRGCWLWTGAVNAKGYGSTRCGQRTCLAHRLAYEWAVGPIPDGLTLDHLCRTRPCIRPHHLEPVTQAENVRRAVEARRWAA